MAYFSRTMAKITPENFSSERVKSITVRVCITDILLQGGPVAMGWVGHPSELRWTLDG